jgi:polysaccharide export outer membrane protein
MVWNEPSLSTDAPVRLDGKITVPLLGDLQAAGRTPDELTVEIRTSLKRFLEVPQVTVSVAQAISARFYVIGEVTTSGSFALNGRITILQALAIAGGFREFAHRERIMVIRDGQDGRVAITFNYRDLESGTKLEQDIPLAPGDIIIVP